MTAPLSTLTATWSSGATAYNAIKMDVTDTGYASTSKLLDLQIGGASKFSVDPAGVLVGQNFSSTAQGLVPASGGGTTNFLRADATWAAAGGGAPGGSTLQLEYNNAGAFGGMSGTSWDDTNRSLTMTGATVTTSHPVFDLSQTWNAGGVTFTGWKFNVTETAYALGSKLVDVQIGGTSCFRIEGDGNTVIDQQTGGISTMFSVKYQGADQLLVRVGSVTSPGNIGFGNGGHTNVLNIDAGNANIWSVALKVIGFGDDGGANTKGWMQWGGEITATADLSKTSDTTLANITGMSVSLQASRKYRFEVHLPCTCGASAGGVKAALAGTATWTSIIYDGWTMDGNTIAGYARATAIATAVGAATTTSTTPTIIIKGFGTVNAGGTFTTQFGQNVSNATASVAKTGATMLVFDMP